MEEIEIKATLVVVQCSVYLLKLDSSSFAFKNACILINMAYDKVSE